MTAQLRWIKLVDREMLPKTDFIKVFRVEGRSVCLTYHQQGYFATQSRCPHAGADLSQGWCKNGKLICPFHRYEYDLKSGKGAPGQGDYIETYPLEVRSNGIYIGFKESWYKQLINRIWRRKSSK